MKIKEFLKPDWRKVLVFVIIMVSIVIIPLMVLISIFSIFDDVCFDPVSDALRFPCNHPLLLYPISILLYPVTIFLYFFTTLVPIPFGELIAAFIFIICVYLLSCLMISTYEKLRSRKK